MTQRTVDTPFARLGPPFRADPYPFYEALRRGGSVVWMPEVFGLGAWMVTGHAACAAALKNKQLGKEGHRVIPPEKLARIPHEGAQVAEHRKGNMLFRDPPDHTRLRGLVSQAFTPRMVERLRPDIEAIADELLSAVEGAGRADLIRDYAFPLPVIVIAQMLGIPPEDRDRFREWSSAQTLGIKLDVTADELRRVDTAIRELGEYLKGVIEDRRKTPRADLISDLVRAQDGSDRLTLDELLGTCRLLLSAGHETTMNLIGNGVLALLRSPDERAALASGSAPLPGAVDELLRYDAPVQMTVRYAMEDTPLDDGHTAKRGDLVVIVYGAANRDPAVFEDPGRLDVRRAPLVLRRDPLLPGRPPGPARGPDRRRRAAPALPEARARGRAARVALSRGAAGARGAAGHVLTTVARERRALRPAAGPPRRGRATLSGRLPCRL